LPAGGTAVLNADDPRVARMAAHVGENVRVISYGFDEAADVTATHVQSLGAEGMRFRLQTDDGELDVRIPALGRHSVHNGLAATAVGVAAGMKIDEIARGLARVWHAPHRTTLLDMGPIKVLDDSYNASPDSMVAALDLLASLPGRRVAILGEMLELGDVAESEHRRVERYAKDVADVVIGIGPYELGEDRASLVGELADRLRPGDIVLIKGSRGAAMDELIPVLEDAARRMKEPVA
jgi:UDP-N-acetylmuramoyl-tripeptide--D-alanyl-D-alanine ligase